VERTRVALLGSVLRVLSLVATTFIAFFLMPFLVHRLGDRIYGYWSLVAAVLGYYGLLDLGIVTAVQYQVAKSLGTGNEETANRAISTAFYIFTFLGVAVLLITTLLAVFAPYFIVNSADAHLFRTVLLITGVGFAFGFPGRAFIGAICAHLRLDLCAAVTLFVLAIRTTLIVVVIGHGGGIVSLASIALLTEVITYAARYFVLRRVQQNLKISLAFATRKTLKELFGYSGYALLVQLSDQLRFQIAGWMVGIFVSVSAVTHYAIASRLSQAFMALMIALLGILSPWFSQLSGSADFSGIRRVFLFGTKIAAAVSTIIACSLFLYGGVFIRTWMGANYLDAYWPLVLLVAAIYLDVAQQPSISYLYGVSRHHFLAWLTFGEAIANVGLSVYWAREYGMVGVALGALVPLAIAKVLIQPVYVCRHLNVSLTSYYVNLLGPSIAAPALTSTLVWTLVFRKTWFTNIWQVCLVIVAQALVCAAVSYLFVFGREERSSLSRKLRFAMQRKQQPQAVGLSLEDVEARP
jgi:O-antigen/teichoic acid export membrane protein